MLSLALAALACGGSLDEALAAFRAGELARALQAVESVPASAPEYRKARYLAGEIQLVTGDAHAAEKAFLAVLDANAQAVPALVGLGRALTLQGALDNAEVQLRAALELDGKDAGARRALGELLMQKETWDEAEELLASLYAAEPKAPANARALFELRLRRDDVPAAEKIAQNLRRSQPKHAMGPFLAAVLLDREGKVEKAIEAYEQVLALDPKFLDAHKNLAILCHTMSSTYEIEERNQLALKHYAAYFELGGKDPALEETYRQLRGYLDSRK